MRTDEANQANALATIASLYKLAQILNHSRFLRWFEDDESRFDWAGSRLHGKLRKDLMFQVRQAVSLGSESSNADYLHALSLLCEAKASYLESWFQLATPRRDKMFSFPRNTSVEQTLFAMFSRNEMPLKALMDDGHSFYLRNAIASLRTYVQSRDTLSMPTGHASFDQLLDRLDEDYLLRGYPHDLLAHDAHQVRSGYPVTAVLMAEDYCSTYLISEGEPLIGSEGRKLVMLGAHTKAA